MISFTVTKPETLTIAKIVDRAQALFAREDRQLDRMSAMMDITACHANGCPLDLDRLLAADDFNLLHDVLGIARHLDRDDTSPTAGQLLDCFLPRFAKREPLPASWMMSEAELSAAFGDGIAPELRA